MRLDGHRVAYYDFIFNSREMYEDFINFLKKELFGRSSIFWSFSRGFPTEEFRIPWKLITRAILILIISKYASKNYNWPQLGPN